MNEEEQSLYEQFKCLSQEELNREFITACRIGEFDTVKYLLHSDELKEHADIHTKNDYGLIRACQNKHLDIVRYFIFDINIEKTKDIIRFLINRSDEQVFNMFKLRDIKEQLEKEFTSDKLDNKKRIKI